MPSDQCIEQTVYRQQKCRGGITGFSASVSTVQRWVLTSHISSRCLVNLENDLGKQMESAKSPKDLSNSRSKLNTKGMNDAYDILCNW